MPLPKREYIGSMAVSSPDLKACCSPRLSSVASPTQALIAWSQCWSSADFDAGATIVAEGEPGRSMFIVHSGDLVVSKLGDSGR